MFTYLGPSDKFLCVSGRSSTMSRVLMVRRVYVGLTRALLDHVDSRLDRGQETRQDRAVVKMGKRSESPGKRSMRDVMMHSFIVSARTGTKVMFVTSALIAGSIKS